MKNSSLYFHYPCFDGIVSGVLAWEFLETHKNWKIAKFCPVDYTLRETWLDTQLKQPCAVVDFLYHPQAEFWADHHETSMLTQEAEADFRRRKNKDKARFFLLFDREARSCASLLFRHLREFLRSKPHFGEMVTWADKIDSAAYVSVQEAVLGDAPALRINRTLVSNDGNASDYARFLLRELRDHDLSYVAALGEVTRREEPVRRAILEGLKRVKSRLRIETGQVAVLDITQDGDQMISRYAPYYFAPDARYSIAITRTPDSIKITAMRNPWLNFRSIFLGRAFAKFGGGGHQRVGAVYLAGSQRDQADHVVESLLTQMRKSQ